MYHADLASTVDALASILSTLLEELPNALPFFRDFYGYVRGHGRLGRREIGIPQCEWTRFKNAGSKVCGRPLYLVAREWLLRHKHAGEPVLVELNGGAYDVDEGKCRLYAVNLPWCLDDPMPEVEELMECDPRPNLRNRVHVLGPRLMRARHLVAGPPAASEWEEEHRERFERCAACEVWHALVSRRGRKPELMARWPSDSLGVDIAAWWPTSASGWAHARLNRHHRSRRRSPYLLVNAGWATGAGDEKLEAIKEVGWLPGVQCALQQYLCLRRPPADFIERARELGIEVVAPLSVTMAEDGSG